MDKLRNILPRRMRRVFAHHVSLWVASNPHPIHTDYSDFDAKRGYAKGERYSFTFFKQGTWKYHNHLNPGEGGVIVVESE